MTTPTETKLRRSVGDWKSWSLPVKLAAVMLVPVIFAVTLSVTQIQTQVVRSDNYERIDEVFDAVDEVEPLVAELHVERQRAVEMLTGSGDLGALNDQIGVVGHHVGVVARTFDTTEFDSIAEQRYREARAALGKLPALRQQVQSARIDVPGAIESYTTIARALLSLDRALNGTVGDRGLSSNATSLQEVLVMMEEVRLQQAWALYALSEGEITPQMQEGLLASRVRLTSKITDALSTTPKRWHTRLSDVLGSQAVAQRNAMLGQMLLRPGGLESMSVGDWNAVSERVVGEINRGQQDLSGVVRQTVAALKEEASNAAGRDSVFLLSALLIAAAIGITITRQLLASLRQLRGSALDSAQHDLPSAVENIRMGRKADTEVEPVPVDTGDEVGEVARAFDEVNQQALRLAIEQTALRRGYSESFVSVSRRSQALLERQLLLFEQLEQDEEDPEQLATLFQLDHLATRMRRNNENLMVLSGSDLVRRFNQPTQLADVLRSAVSEIEQYPRVVLQPPPSVSLVGHAASDLVRLMAELIDNAANFSSPDTSVTVSSYENDDGVVTVDVLDDGIGMGVAELAEANKRLVESDESDLAASRRMGLLVAGRLAVRHGIAVQLHGGPNVDGVRASVRIPAELVVTRFPESAVAPPANGAVRHEFTEGAQNFFSGTGLHTPTSAEPPATFGTAAGGMFAPAASESALPSFDTGGGDLFAPAPADPVLTSGSDLFADSSFDTGGNQLFEPPTEQLDLQHLDIPQQPRTTGQGFSWSWPEDSQPSPTPWFQPSDDYSWPEGDQPQPESQSARSPGELSRQFAQRYAGVHFGNSERREDSGEQAWNFASDDAQREAEARPEPSSFTSSGLPKRTPRAQLAPGSAAGGQSNGDGAGRDPDRLRGRLADFQSGVRRGRHRSPDEKGMQ